ncbi:histidine kinase [Actinomycetospora endophytica]|uniref:histidine kinase n=1 Tax=Actinomycetospora endophytica TaxID=2291215 RepID=A0ABS8PF95_9PSEU|nr:histidine kinase [Actinomycetospora endophytica]MCD2196678.1 histidine kinase [Actinomycetospora endophytica]
MSEDRWPAERAVAALRARPVVADALLAAVVALVGVVVAGRGHSPEHFWNGSTVAGVAASVPPAARRRWPFAAALAVAVVGLVGGFTVGVIGAAPAILVAAYSVVVHGPRWAGPAMAGVMLLGSVVPVVGAGFRGPVVGVAAVVAVLAAACVWLVAALRRAVLGTRRQEVRLGVLAERSRLSAEVHDVVAHSLTGIVVQADGGRLVAPRDPERAAVVLEGIAETGRAALDEVRGLLAVLAEPEGGPADGPGPADVPTLVERERAAGRPVTCETRGSPGPVAPSAGLAAYRVVQEGLTNVVKHAGPAVGTLVVLSWELDRLVVEVRDDGGYVPARVPAGGRGLTGLRDRVSRAGGELEAGPRPDGGFALTARLPRTPS